jgi:hypothetical protein
MFAIEFLGLWHSHHQLALHELSSGDMRRTVNYCARADLNKYTEILTFFSTAETKSWYGDKRHLVVNLRPYVYSEARHGVTVSASFKTLRGVSPIRQCLHPDHRLKEALRPGRKKTDTEIVLLDSMGRNARIQLPDEHSRKLSLRDIEQNDAFDCRLDDIEEIPMPRGDPADAPIKLSGDKTLRALSGENTLETKAADSLERGLPKSACVSHEGATMEASRGASRTPEAPDSRSRPSRRPAVEDVVEQRLNSLVKAVPASLRSTIRIFPTSPSGLGMTIGEEPRYPVVSLEISYGDPLTITRCSVKKRSGSGELELRELRPLNCVQKDIAEYLHEIMKQVFRMETTREE